MHVVATAGHVDHGKSTLVRALTGMEPDRWAEERRRGLTIDLGFAWTNLPGSGEVSFVDVPGHQRFVPNMLAGVGPAPVVLFVVAADEGWSAQSAEHLAAIDALQIRHGVLAVTRSDRADPRPALAAARTHLAGSSLGAVRAVTVSGTTGQGITELRDALDHALADVAPPRAAARVRLWVDRSFTVRGSGTVVTGTLGAGTVAIGDMFEVGRRRVHVRGVQSNGAARGSVGATARVAVNLRGVDHDSIARGDALLTPDAWHVTDAVDVGIRAVESLPRELVLHVGAAAVPVQVRRLGEHHARLRLASALPLEPGDRGVLRDPGRQLVAAGIEVLDVEPPELRRRGAAAARVTELLESRGAPSTYAQVARRGVVRRSHLARLGVGTDTVDGDPRIRTVGADLLVTAGAWQGRVEELREVVETWAQRDPLQPHPTPAAARHAIGLPAEPELLRALVAAAELVVVDGRLTVTGSTPSMLPANVTELVDRLGADPYGAPTRDELTDLGLGRRQLAAAAKSGAVLLLAGDIVLAADAARRAATVLTGLRQPFTVGEARQALGSTRRVVVPLLEHLDALGRTERVDADLRRSIPGT